MSKEIYLKQLEIELLKENISNFWNINFESASPEEIGNLYIKCFTQGKFKEIPINYYGLYVDSDWKLYRIRNNIGDYSDIKSVQDFSYNPNSKTGRFNKDMEKVLYLSTDINTALRETNIAVGKRFLLLRYEAINKMPVRPVNMSKWYETVNVREEDKQKVEILNDFINQIMTVATGSDNLSHKITTLLKDYFPFSLYDETVGWFYQSVKTCGYNLALTYPKADGFLKLSDFKISEIRQDEKLYTLSNSKIQRWVKEVIESQIIIRSFIVGE